MPQPSLMAQLPAVLLILMLFGAIIVAWTWMILRFAFQAPVLPRPRRRVVPWDGKSAVMAILLYVSILFMVPNAYALARRWSGSPIDRKVGFSSAEKMDLSAAQNAVVLVGVPLLFGWTCRARPRDYGLKAGSMARDAFAGVVSWPILAPVVFGAMLGAVSIWGKNNHPLEDAIQKGVDLSMGTTLVLAGVVFAPLAEELMFRGVLLGWLTRRALLPRPSKSDPDALAFGPQATDAGPGGDLILADPDLDLEVSPGKPADDPFDPFAPPKGALGPSSATVEPTSLTASVRFRLGLANFVVSIIFAGMHYSVWPTPVPIFFLSLGLGLLYQRTGSLVSSTALHMTFNGISTLMMFLTLGMNPALRATPPKRPDAHQEKVEVPIAPPIPSPKVVPTDKP